MDDFGDYQDDIQTGDPVPEHDDQEQLEPLDKKPVKPRRAVKRKRPTLSLDQLQAPNGLQEVFDKFPKWFLEGHKGKGHEVRDLQRLLELYQRWHPRLFNHCDYNQFETKLEKMSGLNDLKVKLQAMRTKLPDIVDPPKPEADEPEADTQSLQQQQDQQQALPNQQQQGGFDDIDDDELLQLQAEAVMEANEAILDDFMNDWQQQQPPPAATAADGGQKTSPASPGRLGSSRRPSTSAASGGDQQPRALKRTVRDWSDDDDDDDGYGGSLGPSKQPLDQQHHRSRQDSGAHTAAPQSHTAEPEKDLEDWGDFSPEPPAAAEVASVPGRTRLRRRPALANLDSDDEIQEQKVSGLEDLEDEEPAAQGSNKAGGNAAVMTAADVGCDDGVPAAQTGVGLAVGADTAAAAATDAGLPDGAHSMETGLGYDDIDGLVLLQDDDDDD